MLFLISFPVLFKEVFFREKICLSPLQVGIALLDFVFKFNTIDHICGPSFVTIESFTFNLADSCWRRQILPCRFKADLLAWTWFVAFLHFRHWGGPTAQIGKNVLFGKRKQLSSFNPILHGHGPFYLLVLFYQKLSNFFGGDNSDQSG